MGNPEFRRLDGVYTQRVRLIWDSWKNHRYRLPILYTCLIITIIVSGFLSFYNPKKTLANACNAVATGNWSNNTTVWSGCSGGGASPPSSGDTITINAGVTVTLDIASATVAGLTFASGTTAAVLTHSGTNSLTVNGTVTMGQPTASATNAWNINAGSATVSGLISFNGVTNNANFISKIAITTGTLNANGGLTFTSSNNASAVLNMSGGAGNLNLKGALTTPANSSTFTMGTTSNFNYADTADQTINFPTAGSYNNLLINNTGTNGATLSAAVTTSNIAGDISVQTGKLTNGGFAIAGNTGKTFSVSNGATFEMSGTSAYPTGYSTFTYGASSTERYLQTGFSVTVETATYGYLELKPTAFAQISFNSGSTTVAGNFTAGDGSHTCTVNISSNDMTVNGSVIINASVTFTAGSSHTLTVGGSWTNAGTFNNGSGTVTFNSTTSGNTISGNGATGNFYNLTFNGIGGVWTEQTTGINVANNLTVTNGELDLGATATNVTATTSVTGTIKYTSAAGAQSFSGDVSITGSGVWSYSASPTTTFTGSHTLTSNGISADFGNGTATFLTMNFAGSTSMRFGGAVNIGATTNTNNNTGGVQFVGDTSGTSGTFTNSTNALVKFGGATTFSTLNASASGNTVYYNSATANQTIKTPSSSTYYNLTIDNSGRIASLGAALTISNNLTITSGALTNIGFQITGPGSGSGTFTIAANANFCIGSNNGICPFTGGASSTTTTGTTMPIFQTYSFDVASNVYYQASAATTVSELPTYGNLIIQPSMNGAIAYTVSGSAGVAVNINGNFTINPSKGLGNATLTTTLAGPVVVASTKTTKVACQTSTASATLDTSATNYGLQTGFLKLDRTVSCTITLTANGSLLNLTGTTGTLFSRVGTTTYNKGTSEIRVTSASGPVTLLDTATTMHKLTINSAASSTVVNAGHIITLDGVSSSALAVTSGVLDDGGFQMIFSANTSASTTVGAAGTLRLGSSGTATTIPTVNTTFTFNSASTVIYQSAVAQNVGRAALTLTYGNLTIDSVSGTSTKTSLAIMTVAGSLSINNGNTFDEAGFQVTGPGASNTFTIAASSAFKLGSGTATTMPIFQTYTFNATSTTIYKATVNQTISGTPTYGNLQLSTASGTPTKTLSGATSIAGNLTIDASNTLDTDSTNHYNIDLKGNYTNNGTFTARAGIVTLSGTTTQTLSGTMTTTSAFNNLTITNSSGAANGCATSFTAGVSFSASATIGTYNIATTSLAAGVFVQYNSTSTYIITSISWVGTNTKAISFRNSNLSSGTWLLNYNPGSATVSYVNVARSDASGGTQIPASDGTNTDCLNNTNWLFIPPLTLGGTVYGTDETTAVATGPLVRLKVNGTGSYSATANGSGVFSITPVTMNAGDALTVYLDTGGGISGATFTVSSGGNMSNIDIYQDRAAMRCDNSCSLTNTNIDNWDKNNDTDIHATVSGGNMTVDNDWKLLVKANTYAPGGTVTTSAGGANAYSGDVEIKSGAVLNMAGNALSVGGNYTNSGTFTSGSNTTTFTATTTGQTLNGTMTGSSAFYNLIFNGSGGAWSFGANNGEVANDLTITTGALTSSSGTLTITGNYTNNATFTHNSGTVLFNASSTGKTLSGTLTGGSGQFYNLTFNSSSGGWTPSAGTAVAVANNLAMTAGTLSGTGNIAVSGGSFSGDGTVNLTGGTVTMTGTGNLAGNTDWAFNALTIGTGTTQAVTSATGTGAISVAAALTITSKFSAGGNQLKAGSKTWTLSYGNACPFYSCNNSVIVGATFTAETSTFIYTGNNGGGDVGVSNTTFYNLIINNGSETFDTGAGTTTNNDLTITAGTLDATASNYGITVKGSYTNNGTYNARTGTATFAATTTGKTLNGTMTGSSAFYNLYFNGSGGAWSFGSNNAEVGGNFTITTGAVTASSGTITITGNYTNNDTFIHNSGTVTFNATSGGKTLSGTLNGGSGQFSNLIFNGSGGDWTPGATVAVTNDLTLSAGSLLGTQDITVNGNVAGTSGIINLTGGTFTQNVAAARNFGTTSGSTAWTFNNLTFTVSSGSWTITTQTGGTGDITVGGVLDIAAANITFDAGNRTYHLTGSGTPFTKSGLFTANTSTFSYENTTSATITGGCANSNKYYNLQTNPASGTPTYTLKPAGTSFLAGTLISTPTGDKPIETLKDGDQVISYNLSTNSIVTAQIESTMMGTDPDYYIINNKVKTTGNHIFVLADHTQKAVAELKVGDQLVTFSGSEPIKSIQKIDQNVPVYDISLNNYHLFFANDYLVHNVCSTPLGVYATNNFNMTGTGAATIDAESLDPAVSVSSDFTIGTSQTYQASSTGSFIIGGSYTNSGLFTANTSTLSMSSTTSGKTLSGTLNGSSSFYNLDFIGSGGDWTPGSAMTVSNHLTVTAGSLLGTNNITVNGGEFSGNGTVNLTGGTVNIVGTGNFAGNTAWTLNTLSIGTASSPTATSATGTGGVTISNTLTVGSVHSSAQLKAGSKTWTLSGGIACPFVSCGNGLSAGQIFTPETSTFVYTGNNAGGDVGVANLTFYKLIINNGSETFDTGASTATTSDFTITAGTFDETASNYSLTVGGNYTNNGTYTAQAGTLTLNGSGTQTLTGTMTGSSAFYNLTVTNSSGSVSGCSTSFTPGVSFANDATATNSYTITTANAKIQYNSGSTYTFNNINWNGQAVGTRIYFRNSNLTGGTWLLNVTAVGNAQTKVSYVDVGRSDASSGAQIIASDGTNNDCSNNTNWMFNESLSLGLDATSKNFGTLTPGGVPVDQTTTLTSTTNANTGFVIYAWATQLFTSGANTIPNWTGTNTTPTVFNSNTGSFFGYKTDDSTLSCPVGVGSCTANRFTSGSAYFAGFANTGPGASSGDPVADSTGPVTNQSNNVTYRLTASTGQVSGIYSTVVIYVISAKFP